ncbi:MAG: hypothetical protein QJT81_15665 [Candidatus Thiothrix putei]|uniref:Uncharacterized protein n=1 Tax=Candidatus Thiothrix putei TaxID=3080811 RepID=A0AA95HBZ2_9GAMM|nr:MAG: hypothetical protein QJT81_15665 [Candidatus Thiothrix putei]
MYSFKGISPKNLVNSLALNPLRVGVLAMKVSAVCQTKRLLLLSMVMGGVMASQAAMAAADPDVSRERGSARSSMTAMGFDSSGTCFATFSGGTGADAISACVTQDGNIMSFLTNGIEHINVDSFAFEGYAVCTGEGASYYDNAPAGEFGWNDPVIVQPNGPNKLPLTITRTTSDGAFSLVQKYAFAAATKSITVTMVLKNISGATIPDVSLARMVDANIDNASGSDVMSNSRAGVVALSDPLGNGLLSLTANTLKYARATSTGNFTGFPKTDCSPASNTTEPFSGDVAGKVTYAFGSLAKNVSKTVGFVYRGH